MVDRVAVIGGLTGAIRGTAAPPYMAFGGGHQSLGSVYNYQWLGRALAKAGPSPAEAASMRQFADALNYGVGTYAVLGVGGLAGGQVLAGTAVANWSASEVAYGAANVYLTNPVFWTEFAEGALPAGGGAASTFGAPAGAFAGKIAGDLYYWYRGYR